MIDGGLRKLFRERLRDFHWQSVETGGVGRGVPDANYCHDGREGWVEFKTAQASAVRVRPEQVAWALRRVRAGGLVTFAVRRRDDELWLVDGADAYLLRAAGLAAVKPLLRCGNGPKRWDWAAVRVVLLRAPE
jgi:hypothetical protein